MFDAKVKYVFNDNALRAITTGVSQLNASRVRVGVLGSDGLAQHPTSKLKAWEIAAIQEFGTKTTPHIPERSFIRKTLNDLVWLRLVMSRAAGRVIKGQSADSALNWLGQIIVAAVKRTVMQSVPPPNAPQTVEWKGHTHTLIGLTSTLFNSISHDIVRGKGITKTIALNPE